MRVLLYVCVLHVLSYILIPIILHTYLNYPTYLSQLSYIRIPIILHTYPNYPTYLVIYPTYPLHAYVADKQTR